MTFPTYLLVFATLCLALHRIEAFPNGPPPDACTTMTPTGHKSTTQLGNAPYTITLNSTTYNPGDTIEVTIGGVSNMAYRGFFLQARRKDQSKDTNVAIGTFSNPPIGTKLMTCHAKANSAWSHSSNADKMSSSIKWVAPNICEGTIVFRATVVQGPARIYWENDLSEPLPCDGPMLPSDRGSGGGGQASIQPMTLLLAASSGILSLMFLWQQVYQK